MMGMPRQRTAAAALFFVLALVATVNADPPKTQREIEEGLTCQCGCGLTVASCNHLECGFAVPARKEIAEALTAGKDGEQIIDQFKREYGEKVLSSPVAEGFNLLAWIAPYLGIFLAGSFMFFFFRRRASAGLDSVSPPANETTPGDRERASRLQQEVEDLRR